jgi:hypothetical protein
MEKPNKIVTQTIRNFDRLPLPGKILYSQIPVYIQRSNTSREVLARTQKSRRFTAWGMALHCVLFNPIGEIKRIYQSPATSYGIEQTRENHFEYSDISTFVKAALLILLLLSQSRMYSQLGNIQKRRYQHVTDALTELGIPIPTSDNFDSTTSYGLIEALLSKISEGSDPKRIADILHFASTDKLHSNTPTIEEWETVVQSIRQKLSYTFEQQQIRLSLDRLLAELQKAYQIEQNIPVFTALTQIAHEKVTDSQKRNYILVTLLICVDFWFS